MHSKPFFDQISIISQTPEFDEHTALFHPSLPEESALTGVHHRRYKVMFPQLLEHDYAGPS
jgi:hypothetical protein